MEKDNILELIDKNLFKKLKTDYLCSQCDKLLIVPFLTPCGHHYCEKCINLILETQYPLCPLDSESLVGYKPFTNKHFQRKLFKKEIKCINNVKGCIWQGVLNDFSQHYEECEFVEINCEICNTLVMKKEYNSHHSEKLNIHYDILYDFFRKTKAKEMDFNDENKELIGKLDRISFNYFQSEETIKALNEKIDVLTQTEIELREEIKKKDEYLINLKSANGIQFNLKMSSEFPNIANNYEALQNDNLDQGAGTNNDHNSFIQATFPFDVMVGKITLGFYKPWKKSEYIYDSDIQYSLDGENWNSILKITNIQNDIKSYKVANIVARYWRLIRLNQTSYTATSVFRFE